MSDVATAAAATAPAPSSFHAWKDAKGFGFRDLLDIINPLQHLPIIGSIYRWATGDRPGEAAQVAGDALYGGPIGVGISLLSASLQDSQGHDLGERALAYVFGPSDKQATAVASATPAPAPAATPAAAQVPAKADHPPMSLFGGIATPVPPIPQSVATTGAPNTAARDFLARNAVLERSVVAGTRFAPGTSAPVPLVPPPGTLQPRHVYAAPANTALDIPAKMMEGLDKYMKLEQARKAQQPPVAGALPPQPVDLSM
jgi:hypothetical protein